MVEPPPPRFADKSTLSKIDIYTVFDLIIEHALISGRPAFFVKKNLFFLVFLILLFFILILIIISSDS